MFDMSYSTSNNDTSNPASSPAGRDVRLDEPQRSRSVQQPPCIQDGIEEEYRYKASLKRQLQGYSDRGEARAHYVDDWTNMFESLGSNGGNVPGKSPVVFSYAASRGSSLLCRDVKALKRTGDGVTPATLVQGVAIKLRR